MILAIGKSNHIYHGLPHSRKFGKNIINGDIMLTQDFKDFIQLLNKN